MVVSFESEVESDDWDDGASWMGSLMSLRSDLLRGDLRCLYLGWLLGVQNEEFSADALEPPVPAGLCELSASLDSLIEFLGIDEELVEVAAAASEPLKAGPSRKELAAWIQGLPVRDKDDLLVAGLSDPGERWRSDLLHRFQHENALASAHKAIERRSAGGLQAATRACADERARQLNAKRAAEAVRQKAKDETNRARYLDQLAKREDWVWKQVKAHIQKLQPKEYDRATILLTDLRDLAVRQGHESGFHSALQKLRKSHTAKETFLRQLTKAKL